MGHRSHLPFPGPQHWKRGQVLRRLRPGLFNNFVGGGRHIGDRICQAGDGHVQDIGRHIAQEAQPALHLGRIGHLALVGFIFDLLDSLGQIFLVHIRILGAVLDLAVDLGKESGQILAPNPLGVGRLGTTAYGHRRVGDINDCVFVALTLLL